MAEEQGTIDFIGIGSGKCGSTWLFKNIVEHPDIFDGNPKELNYFSRKYLFDRKDLHWYLSHFSGARKGQVRGEFSVVYMYDSESPRLIKKTFPHVKLLAVIRDPVDRTYSDYHHALRKAEIGASMSFADYIQDPANLEYGLYGKYLSNFYREFGKEQLLVLQLEEMLASPTEYFRAIYEFLGVNQDFLPPNLDVAQNKGNSYKFMSIERAMTKFSKYFNSRGNTKFIEMLKRTGIPTLIRRINRTDEGLGRMAKTERDFLRDYFLEDSEILEKYLIKPNQQIPTF